MEFRILGPLELIGGADGAPVEAPKLRALLGVLLLHPNEVVSSERLIDELWGERPPATAGKIVQTYVSQLRRVLGPDAIVTRPPGYLLHVESGKLDAERFRVVVAEASDLAARGDNLQALGSYREALALWRGPPLADVGFESFARSEVAQLDEERLSAVLDLIDCELALGRHEHVVAELETLVGQHPLRERPRAQLMLALYRCGRQAEALEAYRTTRRRLVVELGLEPGRELNELEQAILTHDPALNAPPREARTPAADRRRLRRRALAIVTALALGFTLALTFWLDQAPPGSIRLAANSVGFLDAKQGRITRSYAVGRQPSALTVADNAVWVANYEDGTVARIDRMTGHSATIAIGDHPTGLAAYKGEIWVWTLERLLVPIDPRYDIAREPVLVAAEIAGNRPSGRIAAGGGHLWITVPGTTVIRVDAANTRIEKPIVPADGVQGAIVYRDGNAWVGGGDRVFPITEAIAASGSGTRVGVVRDLAFGAGSLWVVSGRPGHVGGIVQALRRVDPRTGIVLATIPVGADPVAVAVAGGSVWVADRSDRVIQRVDPVLNRVVATIAVGAQPTALVSDHDGIWVAAS